MTIQGYRIQQHLDGIAIKLMLFKINSVPESCLLLKLKRKNISISSLAHSFIKIHLVINSILFAFIDHACFCLPSLSHLICLRGLPSIWVDQFEWGDEKQKSSSEYRTWLSPAKFWRVFPVGRWSNRIFICVPSSTSSVGREAISSRNRKKTC